MLIEHRGVTPVVDSSAYVAPTVVLSGDVHVGPDARVLHGAVLTAEDGRVEVGARCVVMENAVVRGRAAHPVRIADDVLVGPHAHLNGTTVGDPAEILPPGEHDRIWEIQQRLDFPGTVYGVARETSARERMTRQVAWFGAHRDDRVVG